MAKARKRKKLSGVVYFAVNSRIPNMVKIGKSIDSAEKRLESANKTNAFMAGRWSVTHKVKTNNVDRTEDLAHKLFKDYHDEESISREMFFVPEEMSIKMMADKVRISDQEYKKVLDLKNRKKKLIEQLDAEINDAENLILNQSKDI